MDIKTQILKYYNQQLQDKEDVFRDMITNLTIDAQNDAKGSAGDKHETALSMMHLEQEKLNQKLHEIQQQKVILARIDVMQKKNKIALGSVVKTNTLMLFISAALPKITLDDKVVIAVSPQSPLGSKLMGKEVGFKFEIGTSNYTILEVL